jgi:hypothetical protein
MQTLFNQNQCLVMAMQLNPAYGYGYGYGTIKTNSYVKEGLFLTRVILHIKIASIL